MILLFGTLFAPWLIAVLAGAATAWVEYFNYRMLGRVLTAKQIKAATEKRPYRVAERWFKKFPFLIIVLTGFTPVPYAPFRVFAISARYPIDRYLAAILVGRTPRYYLWALLGAASRGGRSGRGPDFDRRARTRRLMNLANALNRITAGLGKRSTRSLYLAASQRPVIALGLTVLLVLLALSTYNAVTTDRFAADLAITRWVQKLEVDEALEKVVFHIVFEGLAGVVVAGAFLWLWFKSGHRVDAVVLALAKLPNFINFPLRAMFGRPRPDELSVSVIRGPSRPSLRFSVVSADAAHPFQADRLRHYRIFTVLYIPFTGLYLVHLGRHWASDGGGGYLYGLLIWLSRSSYSAWAGPGRPVTLICLPWLPCDGYRPGWSESLPALLRRKGEVEAKYAHPI